MYETHDGYRYLAIKVVLEFMSELLGLGYRLFVVNWYTSFEITSLLLQNNIDLLEPYVEIEKICPKILA